MTASTATASVAVDARISLDGDKFCFGKFMDESTVERVQNHEFAICGMAHPPGNRVQPGRELIEFSIFLDITADVMDTLLPHMTTANTVGTTWESNESLSAFDVIVDKVGAIHKYTDTRIARWAIRAQRGSRPVNIQLDCVAASETKLGANTFTDAEASSIYTFPGIDYTIAAVEYAIDRVAIISDMNVFRQWNNSTTLTDAILTLQNTYVATSIPYVSGTQAVYWDNRSVVTPRAIQVEFTSGADILVFNMPTARFVAKSPSIVSKLSEIRLPHTWQAYSDAGAAAFNFNHTNA